MTLGPGDVVVLIGVSQYGDESNLEDLPSVANNVADLRQILTDNTLMGVEPDRVFVFENPTDASALAEAVERHGRSTKGTLLVYYAGHGLPDEDGDLVLSIARTNSMNSFYGRALPLDWLRRAIRRSTARNRILVLDACYSGLAVGGQLSGEESLAPQAAIEGTWTLASSAPNRKSMAPYGERNTAFTGQLLQILRDGVPGGPPILTADYVFSVLELRLRAASLPTPRQANTDAGATVSLARNPAAFREDEPPKKFPAPRNMKLASRWLAEAVSASIAWPDHEVIVADGVDPLSYWVLSLSNSGERPVHQVAATMTSMTTRKRLTLSFHAPLIPGRRLWYILREETPFPVTDPMPDVFIEFSALGIRWRSHKGVLSRLPMPPSPRIVEASENRWPTKDVNP